AALDDVDGAAPHPSACIASPADQESRMQAAVYGPYSQQELDDQYNTRLTAPDFAQIFERWARDSAKARQAGAATLDVAFGSSADETLDVFHAKATGAPIQIFFHGG